MIKVKLITYMFVSLIKANVMFHCKVNLWKSKFQSLRVPTRKCKMSTSSCYYPTGSYLTAEKASQSGNYYDYMNVSSIMSIFKAHDPI